MLTRVCNLIALFLVCNELFIINIWWVRWIFLNWTVRGYHLIWTVHAHFRRCHFILISDALMYDDDYLFYIYSLQKKFDEQMFESLLVEGKRKRTLKAPTVFFHIKSRKTRKSLKKKSANKITTHKFAKNRPILPKPSYCAVPPADSSSPEGELSLLRPTAFSP